MEGLLFLAHRIPFPPNKGDKIRSFHLLRHLAQRYRIYLGAFVDDADDWQYAEALAPYCAEIKLLALHPRRNKLKSLVGLATGEALSLPYYRNGALSQWAQQRVDDGRVKYGLAFSSVMGQFMPQGLVRTVMDMVDVDSDKWTQYAPSQSWPLSWLYAREGHKLGAWEARMAQQFDATLLVSDAEAALLQQRVPQAQTRISAFENGVDAEYFSPARDYSNPYPADARSIVFTGAMDYWPNIDAVCWFAEHILPTIRQQLPDAHFTIVGSRPGPEVKNLARQPGITVTGSVPDVRPYLAHAACAIAPLRIARGVQNKVLEAMAMARPVIATPQAAEGIRARAGMDFDLAPDAAAFATAVLHHLTHRDNAMGLAARVGILENYNWTRNLSAVDACFESAAPSVFSISDTIRTDHMERYPA